MDDLLDNEELDYSELLPKPSLILRVKSTIIDSVVIILLMFLSAFVLNSLKIESGEIRLIAMLSIIFYEPIFVTLGGTIGQRIMGLKLIKSSSYKRYGNELNIHILNSFLRYFAKLLLGWISLLTIHSDKYGQAIHDKIGNSIMTYK